MKPEEWLTSINNPYHGARVMYHLERAFRRAVHDKVITRTEQITLKKMIRASDDDCLLAVITLENKYKLKQKKE